MKLLITILLISTSIYATNILDYINKQNCNQVVDKQIYTICYDYKAKGASFDWSKKSIRKTYSMANIIPQVPNVNHRT